MSTMKLKKRQTFVPIDDFLQKFIPCRHGFKCTKKDCKFLHNIKTRMCKFTKCRLGKNCNFAHSPEELYIPICKFGAKCKNEKCSYKHPQKLVIKPIVQVNDEKNLKIENFPQTLEHVDVQVNINYSQMKERLSFEKETFSGKVDELINIYETIDSFKELTFEIKK